MKEEEKQTYEGCANSHVAQERRTYQRYLKLKNKFSDEDPSNSRRKRAEIKQLQADIQQLESITNRTAQQEKDLQNKKKQLADLVNNPQQNNPTNSPNKSNKGLYIGLAIAAGLLVIGIIAYFLLRNKNKKDYD